jgi:hypothetical protein
LLNLARGVAAVAFFKIVYQQIMRLGILAVRSRERDSRGERINFARHTSGFA